jgi:hypothetical protein
MLTIPDAWNYCQKIQVREDYSPQRLSALNPGSKDSFEFTEMVSFTRRL